jgi:hypothetical protein
VAFSQLDAAGNTKGTFEVWRRSSREYPAGGNSKVIFEGNGTQTSYRLLLSANNSAPPLLPSIGLTLLQCLHELPYLQNMLHSQGINLQMVRGTITAEGKSTDLSLALTTIIHPSNPSAIEKFGNLVKAQPAAVNGLDITELPPGYIIKQRPDLDHPRIESWPISICMNDEEIYFSCSKTNLNEFGLLYLALHICGNFARYYPDLWLKHIEKNSPLALAIDELCNHAFERLPLLVLSELTRVYHVLKK